MVIFGQTKGSKGDNLKKSLYVAQHLGLGDSIICQAIVKTYSKKYEQVVIPIYNVPTYIQSISQIYQGYSNVQFDLISYNGTVESQESYKEVYENTLLFDGDVLRLGFFSSHYYNHVNSPLNHIFYYPAKLNPKIQWEYPVIKRNLKRQKNLFDKYGVQKDNYVLIIENKNRRNQAGKPMVINRKYIQRKTLPFVQLQNYSNNVFDNCTLIENAAEVHLYDTVFSHILDQCCNMPSQIKCFLHKYVRPEQKISKNNYQYPFIQIW